MESEHVSDYNKRELEMLYKNTNRFTLRKAIESKLRKLRKYMKP